MNTVTDVSTTLDQTPPRPGSGPGTLVAFHPGGRAKGHGGNASHAKSIGERSAEVHTVTIAESQSAMFSLVYAAGASVYTLITGNSRDKLPEMVVFSADVTIEVESIEAFRTTESSLFSTRESDGSFLWHADSRLFTFAPLPNGYNALAPKDRDDDRGVSILTTPFRIVYFDPSC